MRIVRINFAKSVSFTAATKLTVIAFVAPKKIVKVIANAIIASKKAATANAIAKPVVSN